MSETNVNKKKFGRAGMAFILEGLKSVFLQIADAVKTVNGDEPDENGDIAITSVDYAKNLESESSHRNKGLFIIRTAGGEGSVSNAESWLVGLKGNSSHDGYVEEMLEMHVDAMERENPITATIDRDTFIEYVEQSGSFQLAYSTGWSEDPELYGITVTGTPVAGDIINITYVKEERGVITVSDPQSFIATGWNLFDYSNGYARVVKYAYGYRVAGTYTALKYSATLTGSKTDISVVDGNFDIPADGYVWVTGGDSSTTAIYATWEDWTEGYDGDFAAYSETEIDLSSIMGTYFPYGLLKVGAAVDEIDLNLGQVISRVERMAYSEANRAIAEATGREYDFDEDYIYLVRATAVVNSITLDGSFSVHDHGIEMFTQTDLEVDCEILYGNNLKNKLERDVLTVSQQTLSDSQKKQARENIDAASKADISVENVSSAISWGSAYVTGDNPTGVLYAAGKMRSLRLQITPKNANSSWTTICTLPNGHRPLHYCHVTAWPSDASQQKLVRMTTAGVVEIYDRSTKTYNVGIVYMAE